MRPAVLRVVQEPDVEERSSAPTACTALSMTAPYTSPPPQLMCEQAAELSHPLETGRFQKCTTLDADPCIQGRRLSSAPASAESISPGAYRHSFPAPAPELIEGNANETAPKSAPPNERSSSDQAQSHFRAAEVLHERGYAREAVLEAQKALRLCEPTPTQRAFYAWLLYARSGLTPAVAECIQQHLDQALAEDPECEAARETLIRLFRGG